MGSTIVIEVEGLEELAAKLQEMARLEPAKKVVKINASELQEKAQNNAQFRGHFEGKRFVRPTGNLKKMIKGPYILDGGLAAEVRPEAEYSAYVEYGTRFMGAQPYLRPAFNVQKEQFKRDLQKLVD